MLRLILREKCSWSQGFPSLCTWQRPLLSVAISWHCIVPLGDVGWWEEGTQWKKRFCLGSDAAISLSRVESWSLKRGRSFEVTSTMSSIHPSAHAFRKYLSRNCCVQGFSSGTNRRVLGSMKSNSESGHPSNGGSRRAGEGCCDPAVSGLCGSLIKIGVLPWRAAGS